MSAISIIEAASKNGEFRTAGEFHAAYKKALLKNTDRKRMTTPEYAEELSRWLCLKLNCSSDALGAKLSPEDDHRIADAALELLAKTTITDERKGLVLLGAVAGLTPADTKVLMKKNGKMPIAEDDIRDRELFAILERRERTKLERLIDRFYEFSSQNLVGEDKYSVPANRGWLKNKILPFDVIKKEAADTILREALGDETRSSVRVNLLALCCAAGLSRERAEELLGMYAQPKFTRTPEDLAMFRALSSKRGYEAAENAAYLFSRFTALMKKETPEEDLNDAMSLSRLNEIRLENHTQIGVSFYTLNFYTDSVFQLSGKSELDRNFLKALENSGATSALVAVRESSRQELVKMLASFLEFVIGVCDEGSRRPSYVVTLETGDIGLLFTELIRTTSACLRNIGKAIAGDPEECGDEILEKSEVLWQLEKRAALLSSIISGKKEISRSFFLSIAATLFMEEAKILQTRRNAPGFRSFRRKVLTIGGLNDSLEKGGMPLVDPELSPYDAILLYAAADKGAFQLPEKYDNQTFWRALTQFEGEHVYGGNLDQALESRRW